MSARRRLPHVGRVAALLGLAVLTAGAVVVAQRDFSDVEVVTTRVAGSVHVLHGRGGNIAACVGDEGLLVVDSQFAGLAPKIRAALGELSEGPVRFLLNTHWHGDHTGGNAALVGDGVLIAHENARRRLTGDDSIAGRKSADGDPAGFQDVTFDEHLSVHFAGEEVRVFHLTPGHTDGDAVVHFTGSGVAHLGDLYFQAGFPFVDVDSGGSVAGVIRSIETLVERLPQGTRLIPGHGEVTGLDGLREYLAMLRGCRDLVLDAAGRGLSLDEMREERLLGAYEERWGGGFISADAFLERLAAEFPGDSAPESPGADERRR